MCHAKHLCGLMVLHEESLRCPVRRTNHHFMLELRGDGVHVKIVQWR